MVTGRLTPQETLDRLTRDPGEPPTGWHRNDHPEVLGNVQTGDNIAIDGRWWRVISTVGVNERVDIEYLGPDERRPDPLIGSPKRLSAHKSAPVILARICFELPPPPRPAPAQSG